MCRSPQKNVGANKLLASVDESYVDRCHIVRDLLKASVGFRAALLPSKKAVTAVHLAAEAGYADCVQEILSALTVRRHHSLFPC